MTKHKNTRDEDTPENYADAQDVAAQDTPPPPEPPLDPVASSLISIDDQIRKTTGGEPGSGLYALLSLLAGQFLGVPRSAPPVEPKTTSGM